jgi:hypothetical protein
MTQETEREAFEIYYATRFPLLTVQEQNGMFYCDTQEHYLTWRAATSAADAKYLPVIEKLVEIVNQQAEDDGLWFVAEYASEGYLQKELRLLHAAIEELAAPLLAEKRGV